MYNIKWYIYIYIYHNIPNIHIYIYIYIYIYMYAYKIETQGGRGWGHEIFLDFLGFHVEILGVNWKRSPISRVDQRVQQNFTEFCKGKCRIPRSDQEKIMSNFHESWFLTLGFPVDVTQSYRISKCKEKFVLSRFSEGKMTNLKDAGFFYKEVCPQPNPSPPLDFSRIAPSLVKV